MRQLDELEARSRKQAEHGSTASKKADVLLGDLAALSAATSRVNDQYERASAAYKLSTSSSSQSATQLKEASAEYERAADAYRANTLLIAAAASSTSVNGAICGVVQSQLKKVLADASMKIDAISDEALRNALQEEENEHGGDPKALVHKALKKEVVDEAERVPIAAMEELNRKALAALDCARGAA